MRLVPLPRFLLLLCLVCGMAGAAEPERVTLQLKWKHQFQFAGYYVAQAKGYYREAGFEVTVREAQSGLSPVDAVLRNDAQYGVGTSELLLDYAHGKPVVALAVVIQHSPLVLLAKEGVVRSVADLRGKRVMRMATERELEALLARSGLGEDTIVPVDHSFDPASLMRGEVDAISGYATDETWLLQQAGFRYVLFSPRASGIDFYGDTLFTSAAMLQQRPERVAAFREASLRGWRYAMSHPEETADLILKEVSQRHTREHLLWEAEEMRKLMLPDLVELGYISRQRWERIGAIYAELGLIDGNFNLDGFLPEVKKTAPAWMLPVLLGGLGLTTLAAFLAWRFAALARRLREEMWARQATTDALRASERKFRSLMEDAPLPVVIAYVEDNTLAYVNKTASDMFETRREEAVGRQAPDYWVDPDARAAFVDAVRREGGVRDYIGELKGPQGQHFWAYISAQLTEFEGRPAIFTAFSDITLRKRYEQQLREANLALSEQLEEIGQLQSKLAEQVVRDPLTGLHNRRYLDETFPREIVRAQREGYPLALMVIDIDHFKQVNDTYGHPAGDEVLCSLSRHLLQFARASDVVCRYGGEEFILLLSDMSLAVAAERAEQLRQEFALSTVRYGRFEIRCTLSIGVSSFPEHGAHADALIASADRALYQAKHAGRNRVLRAEGWPD